MVDEITKLRDRVDFLKTEADKNQWHERILAELFEKKVIDDKGNLLGSD